MGLKERLSLRQPLGFKPNTDLQTYLWTCKMQICHTLIITILFPFLKGFVDFPSDEILSQKYMAKILP